MSDHRPGPAFLAIVLSPLFTAGCVSGAFDSEIPQRGVYVISALAPTAPDSAPLAVDLIVARPSARPGLGTDRIAVLNTDRRLDYYAGSRWGGEADAVVQDLLVESLRNTGRLRTVQGDVAPFSADYVLQSELNDFQAEYAAGGGDPIVRVTLICTLGRVKDRRSLAGFTATATAPASNNTMTAVIAAFESAYRQAATIAVNETLAALTAVATQPASADSGG